MICGPRQTISEIVVASMISSAETPSISVKTAAVHKHANPNMTSSADVLVADLVLSDIEVVIISNQFARS